MSDYDHAEASRAGAMHDAACLVADVVYDVVYGEEHKKACEIADKAYDKAYEGAMVVADDKDEKRHDANVENIAANKALKLACVAATNAAYAAGYHAGIATSGRVMAERDDWGDE